MKKSYNFTLAREMKEESKAGGKTVKQVEKEYEKKSTGQLAE